MDIRVGDMWSLQNDESLSDNIVNLALTILPRPPTAYFFTTLLYPYLRDQGYQAVRRWTRNIDLFSLETIVVPCLTFQHWPFVLISGLKAAADDFERRMQLHLNDIRSTPAHTQPSTVRPADIWYSS